jgi:hypothetical protein
MKRIAQILTFWFGTFLLLGGHLAWAQERTLYWDRIDVEIQIEKDGSLAVAESLGYVFDGAWRGGYRTLSWKGLDSISDIELSEEGRPYQPGGLDKYQYQVRKVRGGGEVRWRCRNDDEPPFEHTRKTFLLRYRVHGALNARKEWDELYWKAIFENRDEIVKHARVIVRLPGPVEEEKLRNLFAGTTTSRFFRGGDGAAIFEGEDLAPHSLFEVRVQFPVGMVERHFYWGRFLRERMGPILPLFPPMICFLFLFFLFWNKGRDYRVEQVATYLREPPSNLAPGVAGTLIDEKTDMKEVLATIVDLARRGYLELTEKKSGLWLFTKVDLAITLKKGIEGDLLPYERHLLDRLFPGGLAGNKITLEKLRNSFYQEIPVLQDQIPVRPAFRILRAIPGKSSWYCDRCPAPDSRTRPRGRGCPARGVHSLLVHGLCRHPGLRSLQERKGRKMGGSTLPFDFRDGGGGGGGHGHPVIDQGV